MKVLLVNGSPHKNGCTATALAEVEGALQKEGIETVNIWLGAAPTPGCMACGKCKELHRCVQGGVVNEVIDMLDDIDGFVFGGPVYYAGIAGQLSSFMDRLFFAGSGFENKVGAGVTSARRGGTTASLDRINKYFGISNMLTVGSQYWNQVHGNSPEEVKQDLEGLQTMRQLGRNMAWTLKCIAAGRAAGIPDPEHEPKQKTNFIR